MHVTNINQNNTKGTNQVIASTYNACHYCFYLINGQKLNSNTPE
jgi:hypothetical protein